jgi:DNA-binding NarL/FixJ family response regulator
MTEVTVLLADDQRLLREGLAVLLELAPDIRVVGQAADGTEAIELARRLRPDVILMDIQMPGTDGVTATRTILAELPATRILLLTTFDDDEYLVSGLGAGACGYLLKNMPSEHLAEAIRAAARGQSAIAPDVVRRLVELPAQGSSAAVVTPTHLPEPLSGREVEVLRLMAQGYSNREIAARLILAPGTVKNHVGHILARLQARDRAHAVARGKELGLVQTAFPLPQERGAAPSPFWGEGWGERGIAGYVRFPPPPAPPPKEGRKLRIGQPAYSPSRRMCLRIGQPALASVLVSLLYCQ